MRFSEDELVEMAHDIDTGWAAGMGEAALRIVPELRRLYALEDALPPPRTRADDCTVCGAVGVEPCDAGLHS